MTSLGEQIAVLDGLSTIDPSRGVNYGGGSNYYPGSPLLPSSAGLASTLINPARAKNHIPNSYATRGNINASGGANMSGGSDYAPGLPLMTSTIGLAGMAAADRDLMQKDNAISVQRVINASNGANMSGGSAYPDNNPIPLMTSSVGLSGVGIVDPGEGMHGGGSSYPDGGRWPLLPSQSGLAATANIANTFLAKKGVNVKPRKGTGRLLQDATGKVSDLLKALKAVAANPGRPMVDRQNAQLLVDALQRAWTMRLVGRAA